MPSSSFCKGLVLWMTLPSFPSKKKKKKILPQDLKILLGFGIQPCFHQLLSTGPVAWPGTNQNHKEKAAVLRKLIHIWVSLKCPAHRNSRNLSSLNHENSIPTLIHTSFFLFSFGIWVCICLLVCLWEHNLGRTRWKLFWSSFYSCNWEKENRIGLIEYFFHS